MACRRTAGSTRCSRTAPSGRKSAKTWTEEGRKTRNAMAAEASGHANQERTAEQDVAVVVWGKESIEQPQIGNRSQNASSALNN